MKWVSEWAKQTNECSVEKGINFNAEKILPMHIWMQNVRLGVCVCLNVKIE